MHAHPDFQLVISYNPGYQNAAQGSQAVDAAALRRDRVRLSRSRAPRAEIVAHEAGVDRGLARRLVAFGGRTRALEGHGLEEGASTRMLIHAARLIARGIEPVAACRLAVAVPITDDPDSREALEALCAAEF